MANSWQAVANIPGGVSPDTMILLTDGSVLVHNAYGADWYRLTPDPQGNYAGGSWSGALRMAGARQFFASGILRDGRLFAVGGEYYAAGSNANANGGSTTTLGEVFDPLTNAWSALAKPASMNFISSDAVSCILADGRVLFGSPGSNRTAVWDPDTDNWQEAGLAFGASATPTKSGNTNEESWTLLADGTVLTVQVVGAPAAEKYVPGTDRWVPAGNTSGTLPLGSLVDPVSGSTITIKEIGPAITLPDKRAFFVGGTGRTSLYTPPAAPGQPGSWSSGPNLPADSSANTYNSANGNLQTAIDAPGTLLPNGNVLFVAGNTVREVNNGNIQFWSNPCTCYVFNPTSGGPGSISALSPQPPSNGVDVWRSRLLGLPTGQVLFSTQQGNMLQLLTPDGSTGPQNSWRPTVTSAPATLVAGRVHVLTGTQFNGLSQGSSYGDDAGVATNFPVVRVTAQDGTVRYLRTHDFSSMGIATGTAPQTVSVDVPGDLAAGQYSLVVVANGIASAPVSVHVSRQSLTLLVDRSTYSQGEIQSLINLDGAPARIDDALYVLVEGFRPSELGLDAGNLGNPPSWPGVVSAQPGISFDFRGPVLPQDPSLPDRPQRFTYPYRVSFANAGVFSFTPTVQPVAVTASLNASGASVQAVGVLQLVKTPNPYVLHGDVAHGHPWYLSIDLRVFQAKAGQTRFGAHVGTGGAARTNATAFIQQVITNLNANPGVADGIFDGLPIEEENETLAIVPTDAGGTPVYNFAVARLRYRDTISATNVRTFFRLWPAQQTNAAFNTGTLYRTASNAGGQRIPLLGVQGDEIATIPFFATPRINTTAAGMRTQTDAPNVRTLAANPLGGEVHAYFGAWLDINQPGDLLFPQRLLGPVPGNLPDGPFSGISPLLSIQQLVRSEHQCLIAEVAFDPTPIPTGADPSLSDKLTQRNLTFVNVPNPGLVASRRAPQTLEVRATPAAYPPEIPVDELMIEWGSLPPGTTANLYLPEVAAADVVRLADELYADHALSVADDHTISCPTGPVTYLPVPRADVANLAGLLTVELPLGIRKGERHRVVVRQVTTAYFRYQRGDTHTLGVLRIAAANGSEAVEPPGVEEVVGPDLTEVSAEPGVTTLTTGKAPAAAVVTRPELLWRRTLGVFSLLIPVGTKGELLARETRLLSVLRWIQKSVLPGSHWYLVFLRYVDQQADRVRELGGDPDSVEPDPNGGVTVKGHHGAGGTDGEGTDGGLHGKDRGERWLRRTGKVAELLYDRYGEFIGFVLDTEDGRLPFEGSEAHLERVARQAWAERTTVTVSAEGHDPDRPLRIALQAAGPARED